MKRTLQRAVPKESTVAASMLIDQVRYLEHLGHSAKEILRELRMQPDILRRPEDRLPGSLMERLWELSIRLTNDPNFGLHAAENFNPGALNVLGYVLLSCASAGEALGRFAQYVKLLNDGLHVRVVQEGLRTVCHFDIVQGLDNYLSRAPRQAMETLSCGTLITMRRLTGKPIHPLAVTFQHSAPQDTVEHTRVLGSVQFDAPENSIAFRSADLSGNMRSSSPALLALLETQARDLVSQLGRHGLAGERVLAVLARRVPGAVPTLREVAVELATSERTLQRELNTEKTSYRQLVEDTRRELAYRHLARPGTSASETAFLLGFSEPSAFTRAFRRWTGSPPSQFQAG